MMSNLWFVCDLVRISSHLWRFNLTFSLYDAMILTCILNGRQRWGSVSAFFLRVGHESKVHLTTEHDFHKNTFDLVL